MSESVPAEDCLQLRLYIAGMTPVARRALANLESLCNTHLAGRYTLAIVDIMETPELAEDAQIVAIPTLVREYPLPARKIVGDLSHTDRVLAGLGIHAVTV